MSEKDKKKTPDNPEGKADTKVIADAPAKPEPKKKIMPASVTAMKPRRRRGGLLGRGRSKDAAFPVDILARRTNTDPIVLGALKAAYSWTDRSTLTQAEFIRLREDWLKRPVKEG